MGTNQCSTSGTPGKRSAASSPQRGATSPSLPSRGALGPSKVAAASQLLGKGLLATPAARQPWPPWVGVGDFSATAPPTAPLPTPAVPGSGNGRSSSGSWPRNPAMLPTAAWPAFPLLLTLLRVLPAEDVTCTAALSPAQQNPHQPVVAMASKAAQRAPSTEGQSCSLWPASKKQCRAQQRGWRRARCSSQEQRAGKLEMQMQAHPAELGTALPAGSWLVFPHLVFQLIAPWTGGTMPGCSPRSCLPALSFFPNHFPSLKCRSQDSAAALLGTRADNGDLLITTSLPFLLNIIPLQTFCRREPHCPGWEGDRSQAAARGKWEYVLSIAGSAWGRRRITESHMESQQGTSSAGSRGCPQASGSSAHSLFPSPAEIGGFPPFLLPRLTTCGWCLGSNKIIPPSSAPTPLSELTVMPAYCLLTILRHCKLISPWLIFSRVTLISNLLQSPCLSSPLRGARWPQPLGTTLSPTRDSEQRRWPGLQAGMLQRPVEICRIPRTRQHRAKAGEARECSKTCPGCSPAHTRGAGFSYPHPRPPQDHICCLILSPTTHWSAVPCAPRNGGPKGTGAQAGLPHCSTSPLWRGEKQQRPGSRGSHMRGRWILRFSHCCWSPKLIQLVKGDGGNPPAP